VQSHQQKISTIDWWSPEIIEKALHILETSTNWEIATKRLDAVCGTTYSLTAHRRPKDNEYRSALRKKFEYMPEISWNVDEPPQQLIDNVLNAMVVEKARRGGEARFKQQKSTSTTTLGDFS
jgi:hypothetical protein